MLQFGLIHSTTATAIFSHPWQLCTAAFKAALSTLLLCELDVSIIYTKNGPCSPQVLEGRQKFSSNAWASWQNCRYQHLKMFILRCCLNSALWLTLSLLSREVSIHLCSLMSHCMLRLYLCFLSKKSVMHISVYLAWEFPLTSTEGVLSALGTMLFKSS